MLFAFASCSVTVDTSVTSTPDVSTNDSIGETTTQVSSEDVASQVSGVPDSLVMRNVDIPENMTCEIIHSYDEATHIDDVQIIASYKGKFGTRTQTYAYAYQYNKSTDLWSLYGSENGKKSDVETLDKNAFLENSTFSGEFERYHQGSYEITIKDIDFESRRATVSYMLIFYDDYSVLSATTSMEIYDTTTDKLCISIPYKRSMVVQFEQLFIFDIDEGIRV
jgi:hypothetical protein